MSRDRKFPTLDIDDEKSDKLYSPKSTGSSLSSRTRQMPISIEMGESMERKCSMDDMESTYRQEGISVSTRGHMRIEGEEIIMDVTESDLVLTKRIGQGACSAVFKAVHERTGEFFAIKMFNVYDKERRHQFDKEIRLLSLVQCEALITFYGAYNKDGNIAVILEYMDRGSLEFMKSPMLDITEAAMAGIAYQIMWGLAYLHFERNLHRDIKPGNVLMNSRGEVKLSDFGISRTLDNTQAMSSTSVGTFKYMSLERLLGEEYNASSDIWSVGIMLIELWHKEHPLEDFCSSPIEIAQVLEEKKDLYDMLLPKKRYSTEMRRFLLQTVDIKPSNRAKATDLLSSTWFREHHIDSLDVAQELVRGWLARVDDLGYEPDRKEEDYDLSMSMSIGANVIMRGYSDDVSDYKRGSGHGGGGDYDDDPFYDEDEDIMERSVEKPRGRGYK